MTEQEWLAGKDAETLFLAIRTEKSTFRTGKQEWASVRRFPVSERKLRLYCCACCQRVRDLIPSDQVRALLTVEERWAEGRASEEEVREATEVARQALRDMSGGQGMMLWDMSAGQLATHAVAGIFLTEGMGVSHSGAWALWKAGAIESWQGGDYIKLLHDIVGNPFRPSPPLPAAVLAWNDATVPRIAEAIYGEYAFGRLPVLADALLDAGCEDEELIGHCRSDLPHVRGCWAIDLILGKQ
jgi:hypothetical protein